MFESSLHAFTTILCFDLNSNYNNFIINYQFDDNLSQQLRWFYDFLSLRVVNSFFTLYFISF